jgi:hypothetical protein
VAVRAEFGRAGVRVHRLDFTLDRAVVGVDDPVARQLQVDDVAFFQVDDLVGGAGQRHRIRGDEILALAEADDQRRALARGHDAVRFFAREHGDRISTLQALDGQAHGLEQVAVVHVIDQVGDHFGVGLALEHITEGRQFSAQLVVVLDDAVMDQCDAGIVRRRREVRVRILRGGRAVRRPAGVGDARKTLQVGFPDLGFEIRHPRGAARTRQTAIHVQGDAAGIIAAVFQALQTFEQDRGDIALGYCADDTAHELLQKVYLYHYFKIDRMK